MNEAVIRNHMFLGGRGGRCIPYTEKDSTRSAGEDK